MTNEAQAVIILCAKWFAIGWFCRGMLTRLAKKLDKKLETVEAKPVRETLPRTSRAVTGFCRPLSEDK